MSLLSRFTGDDAENRQARLTELESRIEKARYHMAAAADAGEALAEIRAKQYYRHTHTSFEDYIRDRWKMSKQAAYELMAAASAMRSLAGVEQQPTSIRQAAALAALPDEQRAEAWQEALAASPIDDEGEPQPTGRIVETIAAARSPKKKKARKPKPTRLKVPGATIIIERNKAGADKTDAELLAIATAALDARPRAAA